MILAQTIKLPTTPTKEWQNFVRFSLPFFQHQSNENISRKLNKIQKSNTTSANPLYCSHFLHVHLFKSSYGILVFSLQNQQLTVAGKRRLRKKKFITQHIEIFIYIID